MPSSLRRLVATPVLAAVLAASVSGCSPRPNGLIGVVKDEKGRLEVVVDECGEDLDFVSLTRRTPRTTATTGRAPESTKLWEAPLADGETDRQVFGDISMIESGFSHRLGAWNNSQSVSAGPISFTRADIDRLEVGHVWTGPTDQTMTVDEWFASPCKDRRP